MDHDIVTRLRLEAAEWEGFCEDIHLPILEAADEIVRLRAELAKKDADIDRCLKLLEVFSRGSLL